MSEKDWVLKFMRESLNRLENWNFSKSEIDAINDAIFDSKSAIEKYNLHPLKPRLAELRTEFYAIADTFNDDDLNDNEKLEDLNESKELVLFILGKAIKLVERKNPPKSIE